VKPSDFAHQIQMTSSFEHWSESTTCEASSERQRCSPGQPATWSQFSSLLGGKERHGRIFGSSSPTQTLTFGSPLRSCNTLDTDRGSVSAHQPAVRIDLLPPPSRNCALFEAQPACVLLSETAGAQCSRWQGRKQIGKW
jgi:hypothetical protein